MSEMLRIKLLIFTATGFLILFGGISLRVFSQTKLPPSSIKTVYITPTSHYDFGFVEPPDQVRERAARHLDEVLRMAETDQDFRWTIESVWQVNEWIKRQKTSSSVLPKDEAKIRRLMAQIKTGKIALSTAWGSMHTDFMGAEELNRINYDFKNLNRQYAVNSSFAMMDDVPGHPTSIPSVLSASGTNYLVVGANLFLQSATDLAPGKVPFYWQSPDGAKVLTWISQGKRGGYVEGLTDFYLDPYTLDPYTAKTPFEMFNPELAGKKTPMQIQEIGITELLNRYNSAGYKYDAAMVIFAHDFIEPSNVKNLARAVREWNAKHKEIQLKIATPPEFFKYIETKYASQIPTFKGEWSGLWSEAKTQSPQISAMARYAHDHAPASEILWSAISMTRNIPFPTGSHSSIYDRIFTYDEHSGAGNTGWIQLNERRLLEEQNRQYVSFMEETKRELDFLFKQGIQTVAQTSRYDSIPAQKNQNIRNLIVYNPLSWTRSDIVQIKSPTENLRVVKVRQANGQELKFDVDEAGNVIFVARNVPPLGYSTFEIETATGANNSTLKEEKDKTEISNDNFRVKMREDGSVESIYNLRTKREIVNNQGEIPFNQILRVEGSQGSRLPSPIAPEISVQKGEQMTRIVVRRPRVANDLSVLTIYDELDRVEIRNELDRAQIPFPGGEDNWSDSYYFAFPFALSKENLKIMRGGQKWFDKLPDDYLSGARQDSVTTQHAIGLTDGANSITLAHRQAFHFAYAGFVNTKNTPKDAPKEFPAMYTGKFPLPEATVYSRAFRHTAQADTVDLGIVNFPTVEPGLDSRAAFDYAISDSGKFDEIRAWQFGANFNVPLRGVFLNVSPTENSRSFFSTNQPNVQIVTVKPFFTSINHGEVGATPLNPQKNKVFVIRLQEFTGRATTAQINLPIKIKSAATVNLTEEKVLQNINLIAPLTVSLKPFETATVKIEIE